MCNYGITQVRNFEKHIIDSTKIEEPILEKVFPGVEFLLQTSDITRPPSKRIIGKFNNERFYLLDDINKLLIQFENDKRVSLEDKTEAFLFLYFKYIVESTNYIIPIDNKYFTDFTLSKKSKHIEGRDFNYQATYNYNNKTYKMYFIIEENQIREYRIYLDDKYIGSSRYSIIKKRL